MKKVGPTQPEEQLAYIGPSWEDLNRVVGRTALVAEFEGVANGKKVYFRVNSLGRVRGTGPFLTRCTSLDGKKEVRLLGHSPKGHDKPSQFSVVG